MTFRHGMVSPRSFNRVKYFICSYRMLPETLEVSQSGESKYWLLDEASFRRDNVGVHVQVLLPQAAIKYDEPDERTEFTAEELEELSNLLIGIKDWEAQQQVLSVAGCLVNFKGEEGAEEFYYPASLNGLSPEEHNLYNQPPFIGLITAICGDLECPGKRSVCFVCCGFKNGTGKFDFSR